MHDSRPILFGNVIYCASFSYVHTYSLPYGYQVILDLHPSTSRKVRRPTNNPIVGAVRGTPSHTEWCGQPLPINPLMARQPLPSASTWGIKLCPPHPPLIPDPTTVPPSGQTQFPPATISHSPPSPVGQPSDNSQPHLSGAQDEEDDLANLHRLYAELNKKDRRVKAIQLR